MDIDPLSKDDGFFLVFYFWAMDKTFHTMNYSITSLGVSDFQGAELHLRKVPLVSLLDEVQFNKRSSSRV
jgi:hypothetical protein